MNCRRAIFRYIVIDRCLSTYTEPMTKAEIRDKVNEKLRDIGLKEVSMNTITHDLIDIRERQFFDAPVKLLRESTNTVRYCYSIPYYSIFSKNNIHLKHIQL